MCDFSLPGSRQTSPHRPRSLSEPVPAMALLTTVEILNSESGN